MKTTYSIAEAKEMAVAAQGLNLQFIDQDRTVYEIIRQLGYLQIDTISVVARTHEHTLWTRNNAFFADLLYATQREERSIFEYWAHAMSYVPMKDYRYFLPVMKSFHNREGKWAKERYEKYGHLLDAVYQRVKEEGPMKSRDFTPQKTNTPKTWWDWRPEKIVLELLLWRGDLMVSERQGFQKVYDLTERVLPDWVNTQYPTDEEIGCYIVQQALTAYGIATEKDIRGLFHEITADLVRIGLQAQLEAGIVQSVKIETQPDQVYYVLTDNINDAVINQQAVSILSPFDNLIIQRERVQQLFDFTYTLECYVPAIKRVFGYYVMPILYGSNLIARLDPKADRKKKNFIIRSLFFEETFQPRDEFYHSFAPRLKGMMQFNGCERIVVEHVAREKEKQPLLAALKACGVEIQASQ
ncbi:MAG: YcaQ family DNA glycosylase [Anaerolineaceae bacterium]|nr:YcaQ family DNA glycosylase [Anaerolineaceae bacterium]